MVDMAGGLAPRFGPVDEQDLGNAYPWPPSGERWVRGMMVTTVDGAGMGADGRSGQISGPADRAVMAEVRKFSDAILIGAATFRAERYRPQKATQELAGSRAALGLGPAPTMVIVSGSLDLPWHEDTFRDSTVRPLVVTTQACDRERLHTARRHAEVAVLPGEHLRVSDLMDVLSERGLKRILCEGGPHLLAQIVQAGFLDELDLTVSPVLMGGGQIPLGEAGPVPTRLRLVQVLFSDGFLFTRYLNASSKVDSPKGYQ